MKNRVLNFISFKPRTKLIILFGLCFLMIPYQVFGEDRLLVKNGTGATTFKVEDNGAVSCSDILLANGAMAWGSAPFVLGQDLGNRGVVITDKAASNPKNIYFGWNVGTTHTYAELFALQEGVSFLNIVLAPYGGYVGIGTTTPLQPLQMASGAHVTSGGVWTNASSRTYKQDIKPLTKDEAHNALKNLDPVKFSYKADPAEKHVGFIAEDVPDLVATEDRKGMSAMDVVAVLTKVLQDQQRTIEELSRKVAALEKK